MIEEGLSYSSCKKELHTGQHITLPDGDPGIFMKIRKGQCEVLRGAEGEGMLTCVDLAAMIYKTYGIRRKSKR